MAKTASSCRHKAADSSELENTRWCGGGTKIDFPFFEFPLDLRSEVEFPLDFPAGVFLKKSLRWPVASFDFFAQGQQ